MWTSPLHHQWPSEVCSQLCSLYPWCRIIQKLALLVEYLEITKWSLEMSQGSWFSQGGSAVQCSSSFNHSCAEGKRIKSVYFWQAEHFWFFSLKQIGRSRCQTLAKKPAFGMCQAYNISAPKTNLLESSYPLFLASQLQVTCRSRHFRTSLEGKQNVTWGAFQWLLCETCGCCLVTPSHCASKSVAFWWTACRILEISIFRPWFVSYLHLPCADFQVTSRFLTCSSSWKRGLSL